jgi:predicted ABC-type ATPase
LPPELHLIAGPNGSGKSTFVGQVRSGTLQIDYAIPQVINPDEIALRLNPGNPDAVAAAAAREALRQRAEALAAGASFSIETTLSGNSEVRLIDAARTVGYRVTMTYLALESPETNVDRVQLREIEERRTVPAPDVRRRYERSLDALGSVVGRLDRADIYDNTGRGFSFVATLERGRVITLARETPAWVERALSVQLELARSQYAAAELLRYEDAFRRAYREQLGADPTFGVQMAETVDSDALRTVLAQARNDLGLPPLPHRSQKLPAAADMPDNAATPELCRSQSPPDVPEDNSEGRRRRRGR